MITIFCNCVSYNAWISPKGRIFPVTNHATFADGVFRKEYRDSYLALVDSYFKKHRKFPSQSFDVEHFILSKGWIKVQKKQSELGRENLIMMLNRNISQSQRDALFDLTGMVFE